MRRQCWNAEQELTMDDMNEGAEKFDLPTREEYETGVRMECLRLALDARMRNPSLNPDMIALAGQFYAFVKNGAAPKPEKERPADGSYASIIDPGRLSEAIHRAVHTKNGY